MHAIRIHALGGPEVLQYEDVPEPPVDAGQVLIKVAAAGVNYSDLGRRKGTYARAISLPAILGSEVAGTVVQVGPGVAGFKAGDRVTAWPGRGGYAEYVTASAAAIYAIPTNVSFEAAAGMPVVFLTAYHLLKTCARVQPGETVLIQAAASGVGTIAVQLAEHWGARVIATASTDEKLKRALELGADVLINYSRLDFVPEVMHATNNRGVEIVLESVGGEVLTKSLSCLAPMGRLVIYGRASGSLPMLDPALILTRNMAVIGLHLGMPPWRAEMHREPMQELLALVETGKVKPIVDRTFPLQDAGAAHQYLAERRTMGKVLLIP
jgi:NADPH2:quinone reductase